MSVVLITNHDENIYNITKSAESIKKKPMHFKSKFRERTKYRQKQTVCVKLHATMGLAEQEPPDPANFLKKHTGKPSYTTCKPHQEKREKRHLKDKLPIFEELKKDKQPTPPKNFVADNIKTIRRMKAKEPQPRLVVDNVGNKVSLKELIEPVYIKLPKFGRTPKYLERFLQEKEREYQLKKDASGQQDQPLCRYITRDEREHLLNGLKQNWEELQKQYQGLPILTDTIPKKFIKRRWKMLSSNWKRILF